MWWHPVQKSNLYQNECQHHGVFFPKHWSPWPQQASTSQNSFPPWNSRMVIGWENVYDEIEVVFHFWTIPLKSKPLEVLWCHVLWRIQEKNLDMSGWKIQRDWKSIWTMQPQQQPCETQIALLYELLKRVSLALKVMIAVVCSITEKKLNAVTGG